MKDAPSSQPPSKGPGEGPLPGIPVTEEELQKIRERLNQQNQPQKPPSLKEGFGTIKPDDLLTVHKAPCSREGFLTGIGGGAAIGALRYMLGASIPRAANWAVGVGALAAIVRYEVCQVYRREEHAKVKRVVKVHDEKQAILRRQEEAKKVAAQKAAEEAAAAKAKSWYRFW